MLEAIKSHSFRVINELPQNSANIWAVLQCCWDICNNEVGQDDIQPHVKGKVGKLVSLLLQSLCHEGASHA
jgi:hypothetical protein